MKEIDKLNYRPFTRFCMSIGAVPTSYLAGLTIEEQLLWLCSYLEKEVIPAVNNNGEAVEELQNLYIELKNYVDNYFENLDVQEEINNKLDDMAEHGELQEIISAYLDTKAVLGYDTINDMINAENIEDTTYARTMGATTLNDKGGALYKIRDITGSDVVDGFNIISISNEKVAERIKEEEKINCFDNLSELKNSNNLKNGMFAKTLGYYAKNDGGAGLYKIRNVTNDDVVDEGSIVAMIDDNLVAELIIENSIVNVKTFGCKGDNETDDTTNLQKALTYAKTKNYETFIPTGKYITTATLITEDQIVRGEGEINTIIKPSGCDGILIKYVPTAINKGISDLCISGNTMQIEYAGIIFEQNANRNHNVFIQNVALQNWGCGIYMQDCHRCTIQNIGMWDCFLGLSIQRKTVQCSFINVCANYDLDHSLTSTRFGSNCIGAKVGDVSQPNLKPEGIKMTQCCFTNYNQGLEAQLCLHLTVNQCEFDICRIKAIRIVAVDGGCVISNCWVNVTGENVTNAIELRTSQTTDRNTIEILNNMINCTNIGNENTCCGIKTMDDYLMVANIVGNEIKSLSTNAFKYGIYANKCRYSTIQNNSVTRSTTADIYLAGDVKNALIGNSCNVIDVTVYANTTLYAYANMSNTVTKNVAGTLIGELA